MYKSDEMWKFSAIPNIEESIFNNTLERFYNLAIEGLVRENLQNSKDAKLTSIDEPVIVKIKLGKIETEKIPGINEIRSRIECLEGHNSYTKETIGHMKSKMHEEEVCYISFEDCNTKGLKGAKNGQSFSKEDTWGTYAYNKGVHSIDENDDVEKARGGSHGIGKIASNAASDLHIMFFANCDEEGNKHIGGTVQLIEHKYGDKCYRSTGYFTDIDNSNNRFFPYENNFDEVFSKDIRGLKIIIPFLREQFNDEKEIIKSVCSNFFIAILQKQLEVIINDKIIDANSIEEYIKSEEYYVQDIKEIKKDFTPLYIDTYKSIKPRKIKISSGTTDYEFDLYFNYNENIVRGRVAIIRTIGMKIEDKKIKGNINKPFNAILIPSSSVEDVFLKTLENESHTAISFEHIKDIGMQKEAKKFIRNIDKVIAEILESEIKKNNPTDGIMDTKDILYIIESQFKKELSKNISTVKVNQGTNMETQIVKTTDILNPIVNEDESPKEKNELKDKKDSKDKDNQKKKKKQPKKVNDKKENESKDSKKDIRYSTHPDIVERLIIGNKEYIKFNFSESNELKKEKTCDVVFAIIDGMGNEYADEFNVQNNYNYAIDKNTGKECSLENDRITDLIIKNGIVQIELALNNNFNKALKFVYYVEV